MTQEILVLGAGYSGIMAANRLATSPQADALRVTVVNPRKSFVERIRLHQHAAGTSTQTTRPLAEMLHPTVALLVDTVTAIHAERNTVALASGGEHAYDHLVYAVGSGTLSGPPDAFSVTNAESAEALRARLAELRPGSSVTVIGGGLTAVETTAEVAQGFPRLAVALYTRGSIAPALPAPSQARLRRGLTKIGVQVIEQTTADLAPQADVTIRCTGFTAPTLAHDSGLPVNAENRLRVDATLTVPSHPNIVGAGDAVLIDAKGYDYLRQSCASAIPMGAHAADTVLARLRGEHATPYSQGYVMQCISIGRHDGLIQAVRAEDMPRRLRLTGKLGAFVKESICRSTLRWMHGEMNRHHDYTWAAAPSSTHTADPA